MQKKDGKWFTRKGACLILTLCLVGAAAATTYYAVDLVGYGTGTGKRAYGGSE